MKLVISLLTCGFLILGTALQSAAQNQTEKKEKAGNSQQVTLQIEGMACSLCEQNSKKSLEKLEGVKVESISASEGVARLTYTGSEPLSDKKLKEAVENAGYKLTEIQRENKSGSGDGTEK